jgi:hypothetical protein
MRVKKLKPKKICLEASTVCTLNCPTCLNAGGEIGKKLGRGFLRFEDFKEIVDKNPQIYNIELSNWGEVFLNKELVKIMEYAFINNIALSAAKGSNLNNVDEDIIEAMVRYKFRKITCAIDGASQETYSIYRVNGNFNKVIENIKTINRYKEKYNSFFPKLHWRFIMFGHNEQDIGKAREMAKKLKMTFSTKLSWGNLYIKGKDFSPIKNAELIRKESGFGVLNREEYWEKYKKEYKNCCLPFWTEPCINYDGRLLGCSVNYWDDYGNVLRDGLDECLNSSKASYVREMLMGRKKLKDNIPCNICEHYRWKEKKKIWLKTRDIKKFYRGSRTTIMIENGLFKYGPINRLAKILYNIKHHL